MGDKSPKNIHKKEEQKHEQAVEKVHHKEENAETQHHPVSGHPEVVEEVPEVAADSIGKAAD
jgi:hypothetical protein